MRRFDDDLISSAFIAKFTGESREVISITQTLFKYRVQQR